MTKKLICPNCKSELENVVEVTQKEVDYLWSLDTNGTETIDETESRNSWTLYYECPVCGFRGGKEIDEFIVEE